MALGFGDEIMRVLIVEDDPRLARGMAASLEAASFAVDVAHNCEDAQAFAAADRSMRSFSTLDCPTAMAGIAEKIAAQRGYDANRDRHRARCGG
jgi:ActR/RegA family two-component response regulator